jgi:hypothetical protein
MLLASLKPGALFPPLRCLSDPHTSAHEEVRGSTSDLSRKPNSPQKNKRALSPGPPAAAANVGGGETGARALGGGRSRLPARPSAGIQGVGGCREKASQPPRARDLGSSTPGRPRPLLRWAGPRPSPARGAARSPPPTPPAAAPRAARLTRRAASAHVRSFFLFCLSFILLLRGGGGGSTRVLRAGRTGAVAARGWGGGGGSGGGRVAAAARARARVRPERAGAPGLARARPRREGGAGGRGGGGSTRPRCVSRPRWQRQRQPRDG